MVVNLTTEGLKAREDDENQGPGVEEGEGQVDDELVEKQAAAVVRLDRVVDGRDGGRDEDREDEGSDVPLADLESGKGKRRT